MSDSTDLWRNQLSQQQDQELIKDARPRRKLSLRNAINARHWLIISPKYGLLDG